MHYSIDNPLLYALMARSTSTILTIYSVFIYSQVPSRGRAPQVTVDFLPGRRCMKIPIIKIPGCIHSLCVTGSFPTVLLLPMCFTPLFSIKCCLTNKQTLTRCHKQAVSILSHQYSGYIC